MSQAFNQSHSGRGHNIINVGQPRFEMTEEVMEAVAQQIGEPRPLRLKAVGSQRSHDATVKLATFLTDRNFIISELNWTGVISPPLNEPVELHRDELQGDELLVNVSA